MAIKYTKGSRYLKSLKLRVHLLRTNGLDVDITNNGPLVKLTNSDGSEDRSVLFTPKEMLIYIAGFEHAWFNRFKLKLEPTLPSPAPVVDSERPGEHGGGQR